MHVERILTARSVCSSHSLQYFILNKELINYVFKFIRTVGGSMLQHPKGPLRRDTLPMRLVRRNQSASMVVFGGVSRLTGARLVRFSLASRVLLPSIV